MAQLSDFHYRALFRRAGAAVCLMLVLTACTPAWQRPETNTAADFTDRSVSVFKFGARVTVAVPDASEAAAIFGTDLYRSRVQPVWIQVENGTDQDLILMRTAIDDKYISPAEAAYLRHAGPQDTREQMDRFFNESEFKNPIKAGTTVSGYVFSNLDEGFKNVNVDLLGNDQLLNYTVTIKIPGLNADYEYVDLITLYPEFEEITEEATLRERLVEIPCCTTNEAGSANGDPLNIVLVGSSQAVFTALIRRGWQATEINYFKSSLKTIRSHVFGSQYNYSPISPLYLFGRSQDIGLQKARGSVTRRNHMRLWRAPFDYRGQEVFIGQISRDIGVKFQKQTLTTHAIDPFVDHTRDSLIEDLAYSQGLSGVAFIEGSQISTETETFYNLTPDPYFSDGYRAVFFFTEETTPLTDIDQIRWLPDWHPSLRPAEPDAE